MSANDRKSYRSVDSNHGKIKSPHRVGCDSKLWVPGTCARLRMTIVDSGRRTAHTRRPISGDRIPVDQFSSELNTGPYGFTHCLEALGVLLGNTVATWSSPRTVTPCIPSHSRAVDGSSRLRSTVLRIELLLGALKVPFPTLTSMMPTIT